jgi:hypothetical protein
MKRYLTVFALLCIVGTAHGAHFQYYAGGFRAYYEAYAYTQYGAVFAGPYSATIDSPSSASTGWFAEVFPQAKGEASSYFWSEITGNSLRIQSISLAKGFAADPSCYARGWSKGSTQDYQTYGIYYQIKPDSGEQAGDDVMVYYNDIVNITATGTTYFSVGGPGTMAHLAITRGQLPPVTTEPDSQKEVLIIPNVELSNSGGDWFSGVYAFPAKIGDVIGIFAQTEAVVLGNGPTTGTGDISYSNHTMILTVRAVLSGDSDYDGDVDFYDLAILANNWLEGVGTGPPPDTTPPTPDPVQWASVPKETYCEPGSGEFGYCAEMTAAVATDPSGGVQYKFECTTEGGFSSGWQSSPYYEVQVGRTEQYHRFRVKARDIHGNVSFNWSTELPAVP